MGTFVTAYLIVWLALALYVHRLTIRQREIERDFRVLRERIDESADPDNPDMPISTAA